MLPSKLPLILEVGQQNHSYLWEVTEFLWREHVCVEEKYFTNVKVSKILQA